MWTKTNCGSTSDQSRNHSWDLRREIASPLPCPHYNPPTPHTLFLIRLQIALRYFLRLPLWLPHCMVQLPVTVTVLKHLLWVHQCIGCRASDHNQRGKGLTKSLCTKTQSTSPHTLSRQRKWWNGSKWFQWMCFPFCLIFSALNMIYWSGALNLRREELGVDIVDCPTQLTWIFICVPW